MVKHADSTIVKPKLPRKRKKRAIKAQGRKWYYDTIKLYYVTQKNHKFKEPVCKFWVNDSVVNQPFESGGKIALIPTPSKFW